jgi:hypothetical protein
MCFGWDLPHLQAPVNGCIYADSSRSFEGNEITGSIPEELGLLSKLQLLDLAGNRLSGTIPSSLGQLKSLSSLYAIQPYSHHQLAMAVDIAEQRKHTLFPELWIWMNRDDLPGFLLITLCCSAGC